MSSEKHPNLQLNKWTPSDYVKMAEFNENFKKIDDKAKEITDAKTDYDGVAHADLPERLATDFGKVTSQLAETTTLSKGGRSHTLVIAASDSTAKAKSTADVVCTGVNDELTIQQAIDNYTSIAFDVFFRNGNYNIDSFTDTGWGYVAIGFKGASNKREIRFTGENMPWFQNYPDYQIANGVIFNVKQSALDAVPPASFANVIAAVPNPDTTEPFPGRTITMKRFGIKFPTNQRANTRGIYLGRASAEDLEDIIVSVDIPFASLQLPATFTTGIAGIEGSKIARNKLKNVWCLGFEKGFDLPGEHLWVEDCLAVYCKYPYYLASGEGAVYHKNLFLNSGHEDCINGVFIGAQAQAGTLFEFRSYDVEQRPSSIWNQTGFATEAVPGNSKGIVTYTSTVAGVGIAPQAFWTNGHGQNFKTWQATDARSGTTAQRPSSPQYLQEYWDTTLGKMIIWNGTAWKDAMGTTV